MIANETKKWGKGRLLLLGLILLGTAGAGTAVYLRYHPLKKAEAVEGDSSGKEEATFIQKILVPVESNCF
jgi:hypothetical protein